GYSLLLTGNEALMKFTTPKPAAIGMKFLGQNRTARIDGLDPLAGTTNYLRGGSSAHTDIRSYKQVRYSEIYRGIDVVYRGNGRYLEYDFVVRPGGDPRKIRIAFSGVHGASTDSSGDLVLKTDADPIVQKKPHVYQEINGSEQTIDAPYAISGRQVSFKIAPYDTTKPLIIDPELVYSTFFGGTGAEIAYGVAVDPQGGVYIAGATASTDFPTQSPMQGANKGGA